jgi:hypothetical protein
MYTTHTELECQMFVERCAAVGTKELAECAACTKEKQNQLYDFTIALQKQKIWRSINDTTRCPGTYGSCCLDSDVDCRKRLDNTALPAVADDEFLLIFGGMTWRNKTFVFEETKKNMTLYDNCEVYTA